MLPLFFIEDIDRPTLIDENAHHASVLRLNIGEEILVSDGQGKWARCEVTSISKREVSLKPIEHGIESPAKHEISVVQALPKSDRAKEAVELLTASGANEIYPWQAARSIGKESDKWQVVAIEASKQSRRFYIPRVHPKVDTEGALQLFKNFDQVLICHESATAQLTDVVKVAAKTLIVIGPEGGILESELAEFTVAGGQIIKLGRPVLRSAHAGLAAVSAVSALMKVW